MNHVHGEFYCDDLGYDDRDLHDCDKALDDSEKLCRINALTESLENLKISLKQEKLEKDILESSPNTLSVDGKYIPFVSQDDEKYVCLYMFVFIVKKITLNKKNYEKLCEFVKDMDIIAIDNEDVTKIKNFKPYIYINVNQIHQFPDICLNFTPCVFMDTTSDVDFTPLENLSYKFSPAKDNSEKIFKTLCTLDPELTKSQKTLLCKYTAYVAELIMIKRKEARINIYEAVKFRKEFVKMYQKNQNLTDKYITRILTELNKLHELVSEKEHTNKKKRNLSE